MHALSTLRAKRDEKLRASAFCLFSECGVEERCVLDWIEQIPSVAHDDASGVQSNGANHLVL